MRRRVRLLAFVPVLLVVLAFGGAVPAVGKVIHLSEGSFDGAAAPGGPFGALLISDAVDQSSGDVYVTETSFEEGGVVDKFNANGEYAKLQLTGAKFSGQKTFSLGFASGVAVDNSGGVNAGDVYVADTNHGVVDRFSAAGAFLCQITGRVPVSEAEEKHECNGAAGSLSPDGFIKPGGVAVDGVGDVYVVDEEQSAIDEFGAKGEYLGQIVDSHLRGQIGSIALDPAGNLYVQLEVPGEGPMVLEFDSGGAFSAVLDDHGRGVGVDPSSGHVYVAESGEGHEQIAEYESSGALLSVIATAGAAIPDLAVDGASGRVYAVELFTGRVSMFGPDIAIPTVTSGAAVGVSETTATLDGHVDLDSAHGGGEVQECVFEYGISSFYGQTVPCSPATPYASATDVSAGVAGLARGTTYHFRVRAANANGLPSFGEDETFTTAGAPVIDSEAAHVSGTSVALQAQINPLRLDTTCQVQYVQDASFQSSGYATATTLPCEPADLGAGFADTPAKVNVQGLKIATTYHYRFLATNHAGLTGSPDHTFATFGANSVRFEILDEKGQPLTQAGGTPYELRVHLKVNDLEGSRHVTGNLKDVVSQLPPGLIGDPSATPKCTRDELERQRCSGAAQVGVIEVTAATDAEGIEEPFGIYNMVPPKGVAAEFGLTIKGITSAFIDARLRAGGDYGVTTESRNINPLIGISQIDVRFWGVPAAESHDALRQCPHGEEGAEERGPCAPEERVLRPFLRLPTSCGGPLTTTFAFDSWQAPGLFDEHALQTAPITGCAGLSFTPSLEVGPTTSEADSPTGLHVDLHVPQGQGCVPGPPVSCALAQADLKDTRVVLPVGVSTNASAANGLQACSPGQVGLTSAAGAVPVRFTPDAAQCPDASKIGTVQVDTPLLDHPLPGAVYIATPYRNPFGSLLAIYVAIYDPQTGVVVKLAGHVQPDPVTGQLSTTFSESPQVPFEDFKLDFFAGARAPLATPEGCGSYAASASLSPWSATAPVSLSTAPFSITGGCVSGFSPVFSAWTEEAKAGAYSPLRLSFVRTDADQELSGLTATLPPGLLARIAGVPLCSDAQLAVAAGRSGAAEAASPSCPAGSQVGTVQASAGAGKAPFSLPGTAYLTGPYDGGPYGLAVVVPVVAGPFDLGTEVVRSSLRIDPHTAQVTAVSDPFPTILKGIPVRLRSVEVSIDRQDFTFNPTSCEPSAISATLRSTGGVSVSRSQRFQVGGCQGLPFAPKLTATTSGVTSKANGASLNVSVTQQTGEAHIAKVDVTLPLALPSRLSTLQQACLAAQFATNPAACPAGSLVGSATASTPLLANPLSGSAYLVSHGGAAFPDLVVILQGEGVTIELTGNTDIKKGITYSHFDTVPDAPINSFALTLPEGPHSALTANTSLCAATKTITLKKRVTRRIHGKLRHLLRTIKQQVAAPLLMPTTITAQNGAVITQNTQITVAGCPKRHSVAPARKKPRKHHR